MDFLIKGMASLVNGFIFGVPLLDLVFEILALLLGFLELCINLCVVDSVFLGQAF